MTAVRLRLLTFAALLILVAGVAIPATAEPVATRDFDSADWAKGLVDYRALDTQRAKITSAGFAGSGLDVDIPAGGFRGFGPFDRLPLPSPEEAWYRYEIRLRSWNAAFNGKLPGLSGVYSGSAKGCVPSTEAAPGWSARGLFGVPGTEGAPPGNVPIGTYLYHVGQTNTCGDHLYWPGASLRPGRWQCVEGHVKLNTPGQSNGLVEGWLDGTKRFTMSGLVFRRQTEPSIGIREMWLNVYFGGDWPTPVPLDLTIDQVVVSTEGRVGCLDPFTDDNQSLHKKALTELHARGLLYGCGYRLACPTRLLTRGEMAALFARVLKLPDANRNYFNDDSGNIFEGAINRIAAAGLTVGCGPGVYCPDQYMTRAEFATMSVRALKLPASGGNAFNDDKGHWAESAINTFAANGLTSGCGTKRFCPNRNLSREEAASFFLRIADRLGGMGLQSLEPPPDYPPPGDPPPIPPEERD